jgi:hypothetical protein
MRRAATCFDKDISEASSPSPTRSFVSFVEIAIVGEAALHDADEEPHRFLLLLVPAGWRRPTIAAYT